MTAPFTEWCRVEEGVLLSCLAPRCDWHTLVQWSDFAMDQEEAPSPAARLFHTHYEQKHARRTA